jgi:hypothetical protein
MSSHIEKQFQELNTKLHSINHSIRTYSDNEIISDILEISNAIIIDYETYNKYIPNFLDILEKSPEASINYLIHIYLKLYHRIVKSKNIKEVNASSFSVDKDSDKYLLDLTEQELKEKQQLRFSAIQFSVDQHTKDQIEGMIGLAIRTIQKLLESTNWDLDDINVIVIQLVLLRNLLIAADDKHTIYFITANIIKNFSVSQHNQLSRDFSEEVVITSYIDQKAEYGFYNSFVSFSTSHSPIPALTYAIISFNAALSKQQIDLLYIELIVKESIRFFRNIGLQKISVDLYNSFPDYIKLDDYEKRSYDHAKFTISLKNNDANLPTKILDYLNEHREDILNNGVHDAKPWLILLYNIKRIYASADFSSTGLGFYLTAFEYIVPESDYIEFKTMFFGEIPELKTLLKKSLIKLNETYYSDDLKHDNQNSIVIANRIIKISTTNTDFESLIIAALVKSDLTISFKDKGRIGVIPATINKLDEDTFISLYGKVSDTISTISGLDNYKFIWFLKSEMNVFVLQFNGNVAYSELKDWESQNFRKLLSTNFFSKLSFDSSIKTRHEVRTVLSEEHLEESEKIKSEFQFTKVNFTNENMGVLIVMDMDLAGFPHNLLLDQESKFIYLENPICNILSTEWFVSNHGNTKLPNSFSKSVWIPIECGDMTINMLYSKIENTINDFKFSIDTSEKPNQPLSSDLNIIVSHGANNIALKPALYPESNDIRLDFSSYIGKGKILIFFVCHSGSTQVTPFSNSISSIVKDYIMQGYSAVIAPFWSLSIESAPIWLAKFLESFHSGNSIIISVYDANMEIYNKFPTVAAWGCMHLYGDPDISISD